MSPLPTRMSDHWWWRPGIKPGRDLLVWHITFDDASHVRTLAETAQKPLRPLAGLDLVPLDWLHMTTLIVGHRDEIDPANVEKMTTAAQETLGGIQPITVELGKVWFHPEAVMLSPHPAESLAPIYEHIRQAAAHAIPEDDIPAQWLPHMSIAYSNSDGPAAPVVEALTPRPRPVSWTAQAVHLVAQRRHGHSYRWERLATALLGT